MNGSRQSTEDEGPGRIGTPAWRAIVARYEQPSRARATWQLVNSLVPYVSLWVLVYFSLSASYWLTLPLVILAGGFLVRVFIIFHDCGHGCFFESRKANHIWGFITGVLTFTPFLHWRWQHAVHHGSSGDLDRRGMGDVWTMTVDEYLAASRWRRLSYRVARNPLVLFVISPLLLFLVGQRFPHPKSSGKTRRSVYWTNLAILGMVAAMGLIMGFKAYAVLQLTVMLIAGSSGVWLFYVQHQFEGVYWQRTDQWDFTTASLQGSSFYKLPRILQWFSGNIGFHHLHHLSPRIPNYNLEKCHYSDPLFQSVPPVTLLSSFKSLTFRLWDEHHHRLVGFGYLRNLRKQQAGG